jgi:hypothetical protein
MYPSVILENQFGEVSNNFLIGGSSQLRAKFIVDRDNVNGLGIRGLTAQGISKVYMHTSATPLDGNPNPADGYIVVKFEKGFSSFQSLKSTITAPQSGSSLLVASAGLSVGTVYVITTLGTTSQAQWEVLGVPAGVTAALGLAFVAAATSCTGTGAVQVPKTGGAAILAIQPVGDPSQGSIADESGGWVVLACYQPGGTFSGSALPAHTHSFLVKGAQAAASTDAISAKGSSPVVIGKESATDLTSLGNANGGVQDASAGTPAGTVALSNAVTQPAEETVIDLQFTMIPLPAVLG